MLEGRRTGRLLDVMAAIEFSVASSNIIIFIMTQTNRKEEEGGEGEEKEFFLLFLFPEWNKQGEIGFGGVGVRRARNRRHRQLHIDAIHHRQPSPFPPTGRSLYELFYCLCLCVCLCTVLIPGCLHLHSTRLSFLLFFMFILPAAAAALVIHLRLCPDSKVTHTHTRIVQCALVEACLCFAFLL